MKRTRTDPAVNPRARVWADPLGRSRRRFAPLQRLRPALVVLSMSLVVVGACAGGESSDTPQRGSNGGATHEPDTGDSTGGRPGEPSAGDAGNAGTGAAQGETDTGEEPDGPSFCALGACFSNADCPVDVPCVYPSDDWPYGLCGYEPVATCTSHEDCSDPSLPVCRIPLGASTGTCGLGCRSNADCAHLGVLGKCTSSNSCQAGCTSDLECVSALGDDYYCRPPSACIPDGYGSCQPSTCSSDADCTGTHAKARCRDCGSSRSCVVECDGDDECQTRLGRENTRCHPATRTCYLTGAQNSLCSDDSDCPEHQYCRGHCPSWYPCLPPGQCADRCASDAECASGVCDGRRCGCASRTDCPPLHDCLPPELCGETCGEPTCQPVGCRTPEDCVEAIGSPGGPLQADAEFLACSDAGACIARCRTSADCWKSATEGGFWSSLAPVADQLTCVDGSCAIGCKTAAACVDAAYAIGHETGAICIE